MFGLNKDICCTNNDFKTRYNNHKSNFRSQNQKKQTSLASFVWNRNLGPEPIYHGRSSKNVKFMNLVQLSVNYVILKKHTS